jgi:hypothetical protein
MLKPLDPFLFLLIAIAGCMSQRQVQVIDSPRATMHQPRYSAGRSKSCSTSLPPSTGVQARANCAGKWFSRSRWGGAGLCRRLALRSPDANPKLPSLVNTQEKVVSSVFSICSSASVYHLGSQPLSLQRFPRSSLTAALRLQVPYWPWFRAFPVSPFVSASGLAGQVRAPVAVTGGRFSPSPPGNKELVNGWPNMSNLRPDNSNRASRSVNGGLTLAAN